MTTTKQTGYVSQLRIDRVKRSATANNAAAFTPTIKPLPARTAPKPPTKTLEMSVAPLDASGRLTDDHTLKTAQLQPGTYLNIRTHDNGVTATPTTDPKAPAKVDNRGRIHLSPAIRKNQNWLKGTRLLIQSAPNYITITRAQTITN